MAAACMSAGIVTQRQRPATANGTIFVTLEDEHGMVNVIVWRDLALKPAPGAARTRACSRCAGAGNSVDGVQHLIARDLQDMSHLLGDLQAGSRDFH